MARTIDRADGVTTEHIVEDSPAAAAYVEAPSGSGIGGVLAVIAVIAALAIAAFFFLNMSRSDNLRAQSAPASTSKAADSTAPPAQ